MARHSKSKTSRRGRGRGGRKTRRSGRMGRHTGGNSNLGSSSDCFGMGPSCVPGDR